MKIKNKKGRIILLLRANGIILQSLVVTLANI